MAKKATDTEPQAEPQAAQASPLQGSMGTADTVGKTIDERMADLLADHIAMGARPDPAAQAEPQAEEPA
jgi:hypothetical protein